MLQVFGTSLSSPTNKVRFVANYLNIPYNFSHLNLAAGDQRKAEYLKINPLGKVPAIDDDGFTLAESNAIIRYLARKQKSALYPEDLRERASVDQWMDYASQHVATATGRIMFNTYYYKIINLPRDERALQDGKTYIAQYLPVLEQQLSQFPFIAGKQLTLADFSLLAALDTCEMCQIDLTPFAHLVAWRKKLMSEAFYMNCHASYADSFNALFGKLLSMA